MRSGRPRKLSERTAHVLVRKTNQNTHLTAKNLQEDIAISGVVVHLSTVQQCLHKQDLHGRVRRQPYLPPQHTIQRQKYATEHLQKPDAFWKRVLWTDEVKIELFGHYQQRYVWRQKGETFHEKNALPTVKHEGGSIMLWGCVAGSGTGNIARVEGRMDSTKSQQILKANITPSIKKLKLKRGQFLQQDNYPKHTSKSTKQAEGSGMAIIVPRLKQN